MSQLDPAIRPVLVNTLLFACKEAKLGVSPDQLTAQEKLVERERRKLVAQREEMKRKRDALEWLGGPIAASMLNALGFAGDPRRALARFLAEVEGG